MRVAVAFLTAMMMLLLPAAGQQQQRRRGARSTAQATPGPNSSAAGLLPNLEGTVKIVTRKIITLEVEDSNTIELHIVHKTTVTDGDKKLKPGDLKPGDRVSVDTDLAPDRSFDAINVRVVHPK